MPNTDFAIRFSESNAPFLRGISRVSVTPSLPPLSVQVGCGACVGCESCKRKTSLMQAVYEVISALDWNSLMMLAPVKKPNLQAD